MKKSALSVLEFVLLAVLLSGCAPATTLISSNTAAPAATLAPSNTPKLASTPTPAATLAPSNTPEPASTHTPAATQTQSITPTPSGPFPVGKFKDELEGYTVIFEFLPDGTYVFYGSYMSSKGTYIVADDQIVFTELSPPDCGQPTYLWSFDETVLILMKVQDACGYHDGVWSGHPWTIQP